MLKNFQKSLLISTAIPVAFMAASAAQARDVSVPAPVAPATSVPGTTVNAAIVTAITAPDDANLKLTVPSAGVVLGDSIVLNPNTGQGDGKIEFLSDGMIGAVDAATGSVTDGAGAIFTGRAEAGSSTDESRVGKACVGRGQYRWLP